MSEVGPITKPPVAASVQPGRQPRPTSTATSPIRSADRAEFSQAAQLLSKLAEMPDVRQDLIDQVRAEIDAGTYETAEKIDQVLDNLPEDLG